MDLETENFKYLLRLYFLVDDYLSNIPVSPENLPEVIVSFCSLIEKIFKIKLYQENPILVFEHSRFKQSDLLIAIAKGKELNIDTIKFGETVYRFKSMFENQFSEEEIQVLIDIYEIRNHFIHNYRSDDSVLVDSENIVKKMGTVWEKISVLAASLFSKKIIKASKPKRKYSEEELEHVLMEEVRKKIKNQNDDYLLETYIKDDGFYNSFLLGEERCPRCGAYAFSKENSSTSGMYASGISSVMSIYPTYSRRDLYKCKKCNLELTEKEYEMAKKIKEK